MFNSRLISSPLLILYFYEIKRKKSHMQTIQMTKSLNHFITCDLIRVCAKWTLFAANSGYFHLFALFYISSSFRLQIKWCVVIDGAWAWRIIKDSFFKKWKLKEFSSVATASAWVSGHFDSFAVSKCRIVLKAYLSVMSPLLNKDLGKHHNSP